ncbi:MAG: hypothetical protein CLLPBCKN_001451 [Chroococcidiopsis cubana SAG 39.79]|nr:hypothetical protein [Chroococcidiopsis cubana]MDZ4872063.1 hypothetical protein [Chroococcidiopsis cubana SAG 39.79]
MTGLGGLNKSPDGVVLGLVQLEFRLNQEKAVNPVEVTTFGQC